VDGGYRLEGGTGDTPLLIDDDEAVAIAVGLRLAAQQSDELAEAALGAVSKVIDSLSAERRRRLEAIAASTSVGRWPEQTVGPPIEVLATVSGACRDQVRLSFAYRAADGAESDRYVEPCGVVILGGRSYLVAFDLDRDDWRTFRLDRLRDPRAARNTFPDRPWPADDLADYVQHSMRDAPGRTRVVIDVDCPGEDLRRRFGRWVTVTDVDPGHCRVTMDADSMDRPVQLLAQLDHDFRVVEPDTLRVRLAELAARLTSATAIDHR
jgi:predicted DNA-binding transcriptional regulator YafY